MADVKHIQVKIGADTRELEKGVVRAESKIDTFGKTIQRVGTLIGVAFGIQQISRFGVEAVKLSGQAEGVERAFKRIADSRYLETLREATHGTVSDLELMRKAVQAENFQLPLSQLASLFEFASMRAQQTGESVDYLVNSIVLGIGRKSPLILDNLGISAVRLRQELKGVGVEMNTVADIAAAVGKIAQEEMEQSGGYFDTFGTRIERVNARFQNLKVTIGDGLKTALVEVVDFIETRFNPALQRDLIIDKTITKSLETLQANLDKIKAAGDIGPLGLRLETGQIGEDFSGGYAASIQAQMTEQLKKEYEEWLKLNDVLRASRLRMEESTWTTNILKQSFQDLASQITSVNKEGKQLTGLWDFLDNPDEVISGEDDVTEWIRAADLAALELQNTIMQVASSFASLGTEIGRAMAGAEGAMESLGAAILQNVGNLMMMMGATSGNLPLFLAGAAIQLGSGIINGLGSGQSNTAVNSSFGPNVRFNISGRNLVGSAERFTNYKEVVT